MQHPEIYRRALIDKVPIGNDCESAGEIWSIGVTIYHVTTGQLPFQVYGGGRNNRQKMQVFIIGSISS